MEAPNAVDLERAVIGGMLVDPTTADVVLSTLKPEYLYSENNRRIFSFVKRLYDKGEEWVDGNLLIQKLREEGELEKVGGTGYIAEITSEGIIGDDLAEVYCSEIEKKYRLRKALSLLQSAEEEFKYASDPRPLLERIQEILSKDESTENRASLSDLSSKLKEMVISRVEHPGLIGGIPTGWKDLDNLLDGLHGGKLYLIAGRPSMGKSSFMICMARSMAQRGIKVGIFSLEMSALQVFEWMVSQRAMVDIRRPQKKDLPTIMKAIDEIAGLPLWIDDSSTWMNDIRRKAGLWRKEGVEVVFIDHILLVEEEAKDPYQKASEVSRKLKRMAKSLDIPVVALCQLSRKVEDRGGEHKPRLSDLRDSGKLEENADVVMFIHRPGYYDMTPQGKPENYAAVIIEKQRDGALGTVDFLFIEEQRRFELLTREVE